MDTGVEGLEQPPHEELAPGEKALREVINTTEERIARQGHEPRAAGLRASYCNYVPELFGVLANRQGLETNSYQVADIHKILEDEETARESFGHGFSITTDGEGKKWLVDLTFVQYIHPGEKIGYQKSRSPHPSEDELAQRLLIRGYVPADEPTLRHYLQITSRADPDRIPGTTVDEVTARVKPLERDFSNAEYLKYNMLNPDELPEDDIED